MQKTILVTGASGLLGSNFVLAARAQGSNVVAASHVHRLDNSRVTVRECDITGEKEVNGLVNETQPDWVVHCAALTDVDYCERNPDQAEAINSSASRTLALACRDYGSKLAYISTDAVYGGLDIRCDEECAYNPANVYTQTKCDGERAVQEILPASIIVRTTIYGWNAQEKLSLAERILHCLESNTTFSGFRDVFFCPILVNDLSEILIQMMDASLTGVYNVVGSERCSKLQFARALATVFDLDRDLVLDVAIEDVTLGANRPLNCDLDVSRITTALGIEMPRVAAGLIRFKKLRDSGYVTELKSLLLDGAHSRTKLRIS